MINTATTHITMAEPLAQNPTALLHLMHLVSPALPVGAYAYSQGFETAVEHGWVTDQASAQHWLSHVMEESLGQLDVPVLIRLLHAWQNNALEQVEEWNQFLIASRETSELWFEDTQMGLALLRLLKELNIPAAKIWQTDKPVSFATLFALAATHYKIDSISGVQGYIWSWLENQVQAAIKLVPLGQTHAQQILVALIPKIPQVYQVASTLNDEAIGNSLPRLAIGSMQHETQYSRLFRS